MSTLQERYADGEFDQKSPTPQVSAAELQQKEITRLAKVKWLEDPTTKYMIELAEKMQEFYLDRAMELSNGACDSEVIRVLVGKAEAVKTLITSINKV